MLRRGIRHAKCGILAGWLLGTIKSSQLRITWSSGVLHDISLTGGEEGTIEYFNWGFYRDLVPDAVTDYQKLSTPSKPCWVLAGVSEHALVLSSQRNRCAGW